MERYLQIPVALWMTMVSVLGWDMVPKKTIYTYMNGDTVMVVPGRWVDTMGLQELPARPIDRSLPDNRVNVVYLDASAIKR